MNNVYRYICNDPNMHIVVDTMGSKLALITLYHNDKPAISRKYMFKQVNQQRANELVIAFCTLLVEGTLRDVRYDYEEDTSDFFANVIRDSLKEVHTKIGLLLWKKND